MNWYWQPIETALDEVRRLACWYSGTVEQTGVALKIIILPGDQRYVLLSTPGSVNFDWWLPLPDGPTKEQIDQRRADIMAEYDAWVAARACASAECHDRARQ